MLIFQGVLFLPYSRNRRNSKWTSSWFSIENVLKVDFLFAYVYLLKGDLRKLNKNGDIEILYSYIIYFFSNFLHINWCSNSGLLDFRFLGPNSHSCITSPWSFLPGRWVPSNHRKIPLQAFQQALHVGYGMGRNAGKWLVRKMFHFFWVGVTDASQWSTRNPLSIRKVTYGALDERNIYAKMQVAQMIGSISAQCRMNVSSATIQKMWVLPPVKSRKSSWQTSRCLTWNSNFLSRDFLGGDKNGQML